MTDTVKDEVGASLVISYLLADVPVCDSMSGALNSHWALIILFKAVTRSSLRFNLGGSVGYVLPACVQSLQSSGGGAVIVISWGIRPGIIDCRMARWQLGSRPRTQILTTRWENMRSKINDLRQVKQI